ncbi:MAG TPA: sigma-70 family RNA polymerase sigma factor [Bryobacteraceae bacterium]|nr:sigma-70 family RNA polymerase sigma factor [Bryobacteraceae bacterium]
MTFPQSGEGNNARLVEECLRGSEQAWNTLVDRYKNLIYSIPLRYGAPPQDAADIFQAVCLDLFNELPRLREVEALQGWLIKVTSHKCYHWKRQRCAQSAQCDEKALEGISDGAPGADLVAELEQDQMVREAVAKLPGRCKEMIELLFFEHPPLPYAEVALRLRLARGSIGFIRGRCLKRLKQFLEEKGF